MQQVLVVGGEPSLVFGTLQGHLNEHDYDVGSHLNRVRSAKNIPSGTDLVLVIKDMVTHTLRDSVKALAEKAGVAFVEVPRKWSKAQRILISKGIITETSQPSNDNMALSDTHFDFMVEYLKAERAKGRSPLLDEVKAVLREEYGLDIQLSFNKFKQAVKDAAQAVPEYGCDKKKAEMKKLDEAARLSDVYQWAVLILELQPELALDTDAILAKIREEATEPALVDFLQNGPKDTIIKKIVDACSDIRADWIRVGTRSDGPSATREEKAKLLELKLSWVKSWHDLEMNQTGSFPKKKVIDELCMSIFGSKLHWDYIRTIRAEIMGEPVPERKTRKPKTKYLTVGQACEYYNKQAKALGFPQVKRRRFTEMLSQGRIEAKKEDPKKASSKWLVTADDIDFYFELRKEEEAIAAQMIESITPSPTEAVSETPETPEAVSETPETAETPETVVVKATGGSPSRVDAFEESFTGMIQRLVEEKLEGLKEGMLDEAAVTTLIQETIAPLKEAVSSLETYILSRDETPSESVVDISDSSTVTTTLGDDVDLQYEYEGNPNLSGVTLIDILNQGFTVTIKK
jgi:hypothetical protein